MLSHGVECNMGSFPSSSYFPTSKIWETRKVFTNVPRGNVRGNYFIIKNLLQLNALRVILKSRIKEVAGTNGVGDIFAQKNK